VEEQPTVLASNRKKLLRRILLLTLVSYSAFTHHADIKSGWQDGWAGTYNPPAVLPQKQ